jgi:hypothetical protein
MAREVPIRHPRRGRSRQNGWGTTITFAQTWHWGNSPRSDEWSWLLNFHLGRLLEMVMTQIRVTRNLLNRAVFKWVWHHGEKVDITYIQRRIRPPCEATFPNWEFACLYIASVHASAVAKESILNDIKCWRTDRRECARTRRFHDFAADVLLSTYRP